MPARQNFFDGTEVAGGGYARAVRVGPHIHVAGTTAPGRDVYDQTQATYRKIATALEACGGAMRDVVRVTAYITDMSQAEAFLRAHREALGAICPAAALIGTTALIRPELLIEIEAYAIIPTEADALFGVDTRSGP
jgi:enamine deaminase RidA (YjgF/YER057c/UK114 family)